MLFSTEPNSNTLLLNSIVINCFEEGSAFSFKSEEPFAFLVLSSYVRLLCPFLGNYRGPYCGNKVITRNNTSVQSI